MGNPRFPSLYQINTRVWLHGATLDDVADAELDRIAAQGFDWVWLLGVWETGEKEREAALAEPALIAEYRRALPDFSERDVCGSCFAVAGYTVSRSLGGDAALARLRERLHQRGLRLLVDLVPNHTALDHPWVLEHPEFYVHGTEADLAREPENYCRAGSAVLAHGRDPYFPGWRDTLQLNYAEPALQQAMTSELLRIAGQADGVRCDMAMLVLPEVFERTWGMRPWPFWPEAIERVRARNPEFVFLAEVYWDLEWELQQQGFDYTYDKRLYDRLREGQARPVRDHFRADAAFQGRSARFLENHDEPRAAATYASAMPVFPLVGSTISTPGFRRPRRSASRCSSAARRPSRWTRNSPRSTIGCWPVCGIPSCTMAVGSCWIRSRHGAGMGPGTASSVSPGAAPAGGAC